MARANDLFANVAVANEGITRRDVRNLFFWYDLFSCVLPFQIIFIISYMVGSKNYSCTMCAVLFVFFMDTVLKNSLERDETNFTKFNKYIPVIKLWAIPLFVTGIASTIVLLITSLGLI